MSNLYSIAAHSFHDIDLKNDCSAFIDSNNSPNLLAYIEQTINYTLNDSKRCQRYTLKRETNEVFANIRNSFLDIDSFLENSENISNMLLEAEKQCHGAAKPSEGALIQAIIRNGDSNNYYYALIKNEFLSAIDRETMEEVEAFIQKKNKDDKAPSLRICIFDLEVDSDECEINSIIVDDSIQPSHAVHWYEFFLGLKKSHTDELNTENAVKGIIQFWENTYKDEPGKVLHLRNDTISYFRCNTQFSFDDYIDTILGLHDDLNSNDEVLNNLRDLPDKSTRMNFDRTFDISRENIKKRFITKKFFPLNSKNYELSIKGEIDFTTDIKLVNDLTGQYFLQIRTDDKHTIDSFKDTMES